MERQSAWVGVTFPAATATAALLGGMATKEGLRSDYPRLEKPPLNPPDWVFGPVWTALYSMMSWSALRVWRRRGAKGRGTALALWGAQLAANAAWTPLFFAKRWRGWALVDLAALVGLIGAYVAASAKVDRTAARLMLPYLGWTAFAGYLNAEVWRRNRAR